MHRPTLTCSTNDYASQPLVCADMTQHAAEPGDITFAVGLKSVHFDCWARLQQLLHPMQRPTLLLRPQQ